ncbi:MAG: hypothetical protein ACOX3W_00430 [Christensenellaceae bacterium]|jgi:hypothetical protein
MTVIRYNIADYMNVGTTESPEWALMGFGYNSLDENPSATVDSKAYISDKSATGTITGYANNFAFDTDLIESDDTIEKLYEIGTRQATGADAQVEYLRVELFKAAEGGGKPARLFTTAVEVSSISGAGTETVHVSGNLHQVGDFKEGTFDPTGKTFTPAE